MGTALYVLNISNLIGRKIIPWERQKKEKSLRRKCSRSLLILQQSQHLKHLFHFAPNFNLTSGQIILKEGDAGILRIARLGRHRHNAHLLCYTRY